ncbi:MAG: HD-GYP domain-containing protein [Candidatus Rokubacteria bacterium]|nr:HD-GYP domain-containing protein [Candidatus Rokubacteria bacterium]
MATPVARAEDPAAAYRRLAAAYEQSLRYAEDVRGLHHRLQRAIGQSLQGLANALEAKDPYTRGHAERVAACSRALGEALTLPPGVMQTITQAGLLHDIGKIGVPEHVLGKAGALDADDWDAMRRHPVIGAQIIAPYEFLAEAALIVRHHHERWDGSGYPDGLSGPAIPPGARIVAVADVFDALTSDRPYRRRVSRGAALDHLVREAGVTPDPEVVAALVAAEGGNGGIAAIPPLPNNVGARGSP